MGQWLWTLSGWAYSLLVLLCLLGALLRKREPAQALGWSLAIVFLPVLGPVSFLLIGTRQISPRLARKVRHRSLFEQEKSVERVLAEHGRDVSRAPEESRWGSLGRMLEELGQGPRRVGNHAELYTDGKLAFAAIEAAICAARHHVHIESYIFRDDSLGRRMIGLLCEKARAGVQVRLILDGIGALLGYRLRRELARAGGHAVAFLPRLASPNLRNHRKIVVCDGAVGFFGGLNVGSEYLGRGKTRDRDWADMHMRLAGPSVWDLQWIFVEDWDFCTGEFLEGTDYFAPSEGVGEAAAQVIAGGPDERPNPVRQAFLGAFVRARRRILIATPYVVPDQGLRDVLELAARSGIEVIVVTQHPPPDHQLAFLCTLYYVRELEEAGVKVFGYRPGVMHAKAVAVDGEWAMVGTANLDNRSMFLNFEQMTLFDGAVEAAAVTAAIERLLLDSTRLDAAWLRGRPWLQRVLIQPARLLAPLM